VNTPGSLDHDDQQPPARGFGANSSATCRCDRFLHNAEVITITGRSSRLTSFLLSPIRRHGRFRGAVLDRKLRSRRSVNIMNNTGWS